MRQKIGICDININPLKLLLPLVIVVIASTIAFSHASAGISKSETSARKAVFFNTTDYGVKKRPDKQGLDVMPVSGKETEVIDAQGLQIAQNDTNTDPQERIESINVADSKEETVDSIELAPGDRPKPKRAQTRLFEDDSEENGIPTQSSDKKPNKTKLVVLSKPAKAYWYIDGKYMGTTTGKKDVETGIYLIKVCKAGYIDWEKKISVLPGKNAKVVAQLRKVKKVRKRSPRKNLPIIGGF